MLYHIGAQAHGYDCNTVCHAVEMELYALFRVKGEDIGASWILPFF